MKKTGPLITSMLVPMKGDYTINWDEYKQLLNNQLACGISDVLVFDPLNWDSQAFSESERLEIIDFTIKNFRGCSRDHVIVGSAINSTMMPCDEAEMIKKTGADAIMVGMLPLTSIEMMSHFHTMADVMPVIIGNSIDEIGTLRKIVEHPNIIGIRTAPTSPEYIKKVIADIAEPIREQGRVFHVFGNDDNLIISSREAGADGTVSLTANLVPDLIFGITKVDIKFAQIAAKELSKLIETATYQSDASVAIRSMMESVGMIGSSASKMSGKFPLPKEIKNAIGPNAESMIVFRNSLMYSHLIKQRESR